MVHSTALNSSDNLPTIITAQLTCPFTFQPTRSSAVAVIADRTGCSSTRFFQRGVWSVPLWLNDTS